MAKDGHNEIQIQFKYFEGAPVIHEIPRVSKPGRRVYSAVRRCRASNGLGVAILSTPKGVMADHKPAIPRRRRNPLHGVLMSRLGKKPIAVPVRRHHQRGRADGQREGPERRSCRSVLPDDVVDTFDNSAITVGPRNESKRARALWGTPAPWSQTRSGRHQGFEKRLEITGVGYRATVQGKNLQLQLGYSHEVNYPTPEGITLAAPKPTEIEISGIPLPDSCPGGRRDRLLSARQSPTRARALGTRRKHPPKEGKKK